MLNVAPLPFEPLAKYQDSQNLSDFQSLHVNIVHQTSKAAAKVEMESFSRGKLRSSELPLDKNMRSNNRLHIAHIAFDNLLQLRSNNNFQVLRVQPAKKTNLVQTLCAACCSSVKRALAVRRKTIMKKCMQHVR